MKYSTVLLFLFVFCAIQFTFAEFRNLVYCSGQTVSLKGNNGVFGCTGYSASTTSFNVTVTKPVLLTFRGIQLDSYSTISIVTTNGTFTASGPVYIPANSMAVITLRSPYYSYSSPYGFTAIQTDDYYMIQNGLPLTLSAAQAGGFIYFVYPPTSSGSVLLATMTVNTYSGFQPPALFIGLGFLPTLNTYTFYNTTNNQGSNPVVTIKTNNPPAGNYYLGAFLYGTSSTLTLTCTWNYTFPFLTNGKKITSDTQTTPNGQFYVPVNTPTLTLRVSRQLPGGYVMVYIGAGYIPSSSNYNYLMDTTQQSYIQLDIPNPNPSNTSLAYPGLYIVSFTGAFGQQAGFIFEASWGNSVKMMSSAEFNDNLLVQEAPKVKREANKAYNE